VSCSCVEAHCHCGGHLSIVCENGCADAEISLRKVNPTAALPVPRGGWKFPARPKAARPETKPGCCPCGRPIAQAKPGKGRRPMKCEMHKGHWHIPLRDYLELPKAESGA